MANDDLIWVDLETTGLDPNQGRILEVCIIITGGDCIPAYRKHELVGPVPTEAEVASWHPTVREMHDKNGLIRDLDRNASPPISFVDKAFSDWLRMLTVGEKLILAGSSVHFDRRWLDRHMPLTASLLHYRMADVSGLREFMQRWVPDHDEMVEAGVKTEGKHRADSDLLDSIALARFYRKLVLG